MKTQLVTALALLLIANEKSFGEDDGLESINKQLNSNNPRQKVAAVRMLGEIGPPAADSVPTLIQFLGPNDPGLRYESIIALGRINADPEEVVPALSAILAENVPVLQHVAVDALRKYGSDAEAALPLLHQLLKSESPLISVGAARAIVEIGDQKNIETSPATSVLLDSLQSPRRDVAAEAMYGLAMIGTPAVTAMRELLDRPDAQIVCNACDALAAIGVRDPNTISRLAELAKSAPNPIRWHAINALGESGSHAKSAIPILIVGLNDPDAHVRFSAEQSLRKMGDIALPALIESLKDDSYQRNSAAIIGSMGPSAHTALKSLVPLLSSEDPKTRREAIFAVAAMGPEANGAVPKLIEALEDKHFPFPGAAAYALGRMGAKPAEDALIAAMKGQKDPLVNLAIAGALIEIDPDNDENSTLAVPHLTAALQDPRPEIRREAAMTLGRLGKRAKEVVPELRKGLSDKDPIVRRQCLVALAEIGPESEAAVPDIVKSLDEGKGDLRSVAAYALGRIGATSKAAIPNLNGMSKSRDPHERTIAAWALVHISPDEETKKGAIPMLAAALHGGTDPQLRMQVAETLGEIGQDSKLAKEALEAAKSDNDEFVRKAVEKALASIN